MSKHKPTIDEYLQFSGQLQWYYRKKYPELNYPKMKKAKDSKNKPTLEEWNNLPYHQRQKWHKLYPTQYPKHKVI